MADAKPGPRTVALFMDGNRRWARARGLSQPAGHTAGKNVFFDFVDFYERVRARWGTTHYLFYIFSTENWNRSAEEVASIMGIFERAFDEFAFLVPRIKAAGLSLRFIGERARFRPRLRRKMEALERDTAGGGGSFTLALSYGGRADILQAAQSLAREGAPITETALARRLWTSHLPEVDLIIRPGGEKRLSNFLLWEAAYSEIAWSDTLWPDFGEEELTSIFAEYASRERRRGK